MYVRNNTAYLPETKQTPLQAVKATFTTLWWTFDFLCCWRRLKLLFARFNRLVYIDYTKKSYIILSTKKTLQESTFLYKDKLSIFLQ